MSIPMELNLQGIRTGCTGTNKMFCPAAARWSSSTTSEYPVHPLHPVRIFSMQLIVLGSGSSVPHPNRSSSGYWLETAGGSILLDCSASAIHRMAQEECDWA